MSVAELTLRAAHPCSAVPPTTANKPRRRRSRHSSLRIRFNSGWFTNLSNFRHVDLQARCQAVDSDSGQFASAAVRLTPYATQFRYPGGPIAPAQNDADEAFRIATDVVDFVRRRLGVQEDA